MAHKRVVNRCGQSKVYMICSVLGLIKRFTVAVHNILKFIHSDAGVFTKSMIFIVQCIHVHAYLQRRCSSHWERTEPRWPVQSAQCRHQIHQGSEAGGNKNQWQKLIQNTIYTPNPNQSQQRQKAYTRSANVIHILNTQ